MRGLTVRLGTGRPNVFLLFSGFIPPFPVFESRMPNASLIQDYGAHGQDLSQIQALLAEHPRWHRTRLSRELCALWGWRLRPGSRPTGWKRNGAGRLKDMACRSLRLKLQARGLIALPPRRGPSVNGQRNRRPSQVPHQDRPLQAPLASLLPLQVQALRPGSPGAELFQCLLQRYHYLGQRNCVGENLRYLVGDRHGRPLACLLFGAAAWQCQPRDAFIGWSPAPPGRSGEDRPPFQAPPRRSPAERQRHLALLTNNSRFLILPWVGVPQLASHILQRIARRLSPDWQAKYGHAIYLLETFVDPDRFSGTCYRGAGWIELGRTTGRGLQRAGQVYRSTPKRIYVKALCEDFRERLCGRRLQGRVEP